MSCRVLKRGMEEFVLNIDDESCARESGYAKAGRRVHPDREEPAGEGPLREAGFHA